MEDNYFYAQRVYGVWVRVAARPDIKRERSNASPGEIMGTTLYTRHACGVSERDRGADHARSSIPVGC